MRPHETASLRYMQRTASRQYWNHRQNSQLRLVSRSDVSCFLLQQQRQCVHFHHQLYARPSPHDNHLLFITYSSTTNGTSKTV